jgi:SpoVK/Ycf46/Vps4 family AAA+-type ATPase
MTPTDIIRNVSVEDEDFQVGLTRVSPTSLRSHTAEYNKVAWDDVGGLVEVKKVYRFLLLKIPRNFDKL